jgi:hypothetical protein
VDQQQADYELLQRPRIACCNRKLLKSIPDASSALHPKS